jgi:RNA polymerase primary sigma factor
MSMSPTTLTEYDALQLYRQDIARLLEWLQKDRLETVPKAQHLVLLHLRLAYAIASHYQHRGVPFLDLIQEANLGLMRAAEKFDPALNIPFSAYAGYGIRMALFRALGEPYTALHVPYWKIEWLPKFVKARQRLLMTLEEEPTITQIAEYMEVTRELASELQLVHQHIVSLDAPIEHNTEELLADVLEANPEQSPEQQAWRENRREQVYRLLSLLTPEEQQVIRARYGFNEGYACSFYETAKLLHMSWEKVQSLEYRAMLKMQRKAAFEHMQDFLSP